jgi:hypothetical protein
MAQQQAPSMQPAQANAIARQLVIQQSVERVQQIFSQTVSGSAQQGPITVNPRNVGLLKGFFVDVVMTITNPNDVEILNLTQFGAANVLSQIKFDDLQNNTRIQTTGWHVHFVNSVRNQRPWGLCTTLTNSPIAYGNNFDIIEGPATIAAGATDTVTMRYYVPIAYSNDDLRGAIYANVVNATMQLQLTLNQAAAIGGTAAQLDQGKNTAVYACNIAGGVAGTIGNCTITVYQHYLDQLPMSQQGPILPMLDLQTIYELKNTTMTGVTINQDYTVPYANFRTFLSTIAIFDNGSVSSLLGADVNYWALRSANFTDILKLSAQETALLGRLAIGVDLPGSSTYYFNHRNKPINTIQYGNMELVLNASAVDADTGGRVFVGYEDFAMINVVSGAGSLPAGG